MSVEVVRFLAWFAAGFAGSGITVFLAVRLAARRASLWTGEHEVSEASSEEVGIGLARRARPVGLFFLFPVAMLGLLLGLNLGSGVPWSVVLMPVGVVAGIATVSLIVALVLMGVLPQRAGVVLADRVRLSVPGVLGAGEKGFPWTRAEVASLEVANDLSLVVVRVDGVSSRLVVDRMSLEAMRGFKAAAGSGSIPA